MSAPKSAQTPVRAQVKASIRTQIDENLKRAYQEALTEEIPDRFRELLAQLRDKEAATRDAGT